MQDDWQTRITRVRQIRNERVQLEAALREARAAFEAELEPLRSRLKRLDEQEAPLLDAIKADALANLQASGRKSFGGAQLKAVRKLQVVDLDAALSLLDGQTHKGKPCVVRRLDEKAALGWAESMNAVGVPVGGLAIMVEYQLSILSETGEEP